MKPENFILHPDTAFELGVEIPEPERQRRRHLREVWTQGPELSDPEAQQLAAWSAEEAAIAPAQAYWGPRIEKFWSRVEPGPNGCWEWHGPMDRRYGQTMALGRLEPSHRVAYRLVKGEIPVHQIVRQTCRNPRCCNPGHLEVATRAESMAAMVAQRQHSRGGGGNAKFTAQEAQELRKYYEELLATFKGSPSQLKAKLAKVNQVSYSTIHYLVTGTSYQS